MEEGQATEGREEAPGGPGLTVRLVKACPIRPGTPMKPMLKVTPMKPMLKVMFAVLVVGLWSPAASAQVSKAKSQMEKVKELADVLDTLKRRDPDEPAIYRTVLALYDASKAASDTIGKLFEPIASVASGEYESRLKEPRKIAKYLADRLGKGELMESCEAVRKHINTPGKDRDKDFDFKLQTLTTTVFVSAKASVKEWEGLTKLSDETLRWLRESLQAAQVLREKSDKPLAALNAAKRQIVKKLLEQDEELRRLNNETRICAARAMEVYKKCSEAAEVTRAAAQGDPATAAYNRWAEAEKEHKEVFKQSREAFAKYVKGLVECNARMDELWRLMEDIEKFSREANPETINKRLTDFERWTKLLDDELKR